MGRNKENIVAKVCCHHAKAGFDRASSRTPTTSDGKAAAQTPCFCCLEYPSAHCQTAGNWPCSQLLSRISEPELHSGLHPFPWQVAKGSNALQTQRKPEQEEGPRAEKRARGLQNTEANASHPGVKGTARKRVTVRNKQTQSQKHAKACKSHPPPRVFPLPPIANHSPCAACSKSSFAK